MKCGWDISDADIDLWLSDCRICASDTKEFSTFRSRPMVRQMTDNRVSVGVWAWNEAVKLWPDLLNRVNGVVLYDRLGTPHPEDICEIEGRIISGTTAYFCLIVALIRRLYFTPPIQICRVAEIGAGYGNMAGLFMMLLGDGVESYTIYDLPDPSALQRRWLEEQRLVDRVRFTSQLESYDLVLSLCSLSELGLTSKVLFRPLLASSSRGFHTWNTGVCRTDGDALDGLKFLRLDHPETRLLGTGIPLGDSAYCWGANL